MAADPAVSPADTIRDVLGQIALLFFGSGELVLEAHTAVDEWEAVEERDKAEIERQTKSGCAFGCGPEGEEYVRPGVGIVPACPVHGWMCDWVVTVRERDGRQIAQLTEALADILSWLPVSEYTLADLHPQHRAAIDAARKALKEATDAVAS